MTHSRPVLDCVGGYGVGMFVTHSRGAMCGW